MSEPQLSERDVCTKLITPAVERAGWDIQSQVREEVSLTAGRVMVRGRLVAPYGDEGKYKLIFTGPAKALPQPIPFADATTGSMQGPRYTSLVKLLAAKRVSDLFT